MEGVGLKFRTPRPSSSEEPRIFDRDPLVAFLECVSRGAALFWRSGVCYKTEELKETCNHGCSRSAELWKPHTLGSCVPLLRRSGRSAHGNRHDSSLRAPAKLVLLAFKARLYALKVQDRLIRLEERERLASLLPEPLRLRLGELREGQLVGLRFCCDGEIPTLVQETLTKNLSQADIKKAIKVWRADNFRV